MDPAKAGSEIEMPVRKGRALDAEWLLGRTCRRVPALPKRSREPVASVAKLSKLPSTFILGKPNPVRHRGGESLRCQRFAAALAGLHRVDETGAPFDYREIGSGADQQK